LWEQSQAEFDIRQPEARAQFWQAVRGHVRSIGNNQVRSAYGDEIESRIAAMRNQIPRHIFNGGTAACVSATNRAD
jgi:hypothetical protein